MNERGQTGAYDEAAAGLFERRGEATRRVLVEGRVPLDPAQAKRTYAGANQGSLVMAFRIDLFLDAQQFKHEMDDYVRAVKKLTPLAGFSESFLPGGVEAARAQSYRAQGIPVGPEHQQRLEQVAQELGLPVPW